MLNFERSWLVWSWKAGDYYNKPPWSGISDEGWTHANAVSRLANGNTLVSLRNFNFIAEIGPDGKVVRQIGEGLLRAQHDPALLPDGNILVADHNEPQRVVELDPATGKIVWEFTVPRQLVRDANRLPNGNTLITGGAVLLEVTRDMRIVWELKLDGIELTREQSAGRGFYKAERLAP